MGERSVAFEHENTGDGFDGIGGASAGCGAGKGGTFRLQAGAAGNECE